MGEINSHQDNVGIIIEEKNVLRILSKRYKDVLITEINSEENLEALVNDLKKAKPASAKGIFLKKISLSSTMGPSVVVDMASLDV